MYNTFQDYNGPQTEQKVDQHFVLELQNAQEKSNLIASNRIVCIDIYADWCGPCKTTAPTYSILANQYTRAGECAVVKFRFENLPPEEKAKINGIPLFEFYREGQMVDRVEGADLDLVEKKLTALLNSPSSGGQSGPQYKHNTIRNSKLQMPSMKYDAPNQGYRQAPQLSQSYQQPQPQPQYPQQSYHSQQQPQNYPQQSYQPQNYPQQPQNYPPQQPQQPQPYQPKNPYAQFSYSNGSNDDMYKS